MKMNAQASIQVNEDSVKTLECAYETLLSMRLPAKMFVEVDRIDKKLLFASVIGKFKPKEQISLKFICLITVDKLSYSTCRLTISTDSSLDSSNTFYSIALISDFFEKLSQNLSH